jgi:transcriptional regulator with XRE-family HTH domain
MSPRFSSEPEQSQSDSPQTEKFSARLREERMRVEPHQGRFAERIGITQNKQSFLENGTRELRADYLAAVAGAGIDVHYVLTGERLITDSLDPAASKLLSDFMALPAGLRHIASAVVQTLRREAGALVEAERPATVHARRLAYHGEDR